MMNMKMMSNEIKQMTVNLLLTFIQTDEAGQRDIYKCPRIRLTMSTRMIKMITVMILFLYSPHFVSSSVYLRFYESVQYD